MVSVNLKKRDFVWVGLFVILAGAGFVFGFGDYIGNEAQINGHSSDEIMVRNSSGDLVSLQNVVDVGFGSLQCVTARRFENPSTAATVISYTGSNPGSVSNVVSFVESASSPVGSADYFGLKCIGDWSLTGCAHISGGVGDSDTYMNNNSCYAGDNDGAQDVNHLDVICCRIE